MSQKRDMGHPQMRALLAEGEQGEEAEPEGGHGVPVPGGAVHQYLAVFDAAEGEEADAGGEQARDACGKMDGVGAGEDVEGVAAGPARLEAETLEGKLAPGEPLAGEEERAEYEGRQQPGQCAAADGMAQAEPLLHSVYGVEDVAAGDLDGEGAEQQERGIEPEDGRDGGGQPGVDGVVVGVEAAGGVGDGEDADQPGEEEEDGTEGEEEAEAVGDEALAGAIRAVGTAVPVVVVAATAGALEVAPVGRTAAVASIVLSGATGAAFEIGG